jgi:DNA-binding LytR/AlgR family response regulator
MINAFVVEDETPARNELRRFIRGEYDFRLMGEAQNGDVALQEIKRLKPNVVFLDIHIPKMNGLEVASLLSELKNPPCIIFVTAYDQYALKAFELNALDYLLKPYDEGRFKNACEKARNVLKDTKGFKEKLSSLKNYLAEGRPLKILGHKRNSRERIFIHTQNVLYFHVQLTEVTAHLKGGDEYLVNATLKSLLEMLEPKKFQQTHRSYVVNLDQVEKVVPLFSGNSSLVLKGVKDLTIPLSRRYAKQLKRFLNW